MANKDIRTNVIISAETKGFETAQQQAEKFTLKATKGMSDQAKGFASAEMATITLGKALGTLNKASFKDVQKEIAGMREHLSGLYKEQVVVTQAMSSIDDKAGPAYEKMAERLKKVTEEAKTSERQVSSLTKAFSAQAQEAEKASQLQEKRSGAFTQGLAQGGLRMPFPFLQRGPGMGRQMAGMAVGMGISGAGRGIGAVGSAAFGGVQGMAQGISAIPYVGGALAGQFMTAAGYAEQNIAWQRARLENAPYMESGASLIGRGEYLAKRNAEYRGAKSNESAAISSYNDLAKERNFLIQAQEMQWNADTRKLGLDPMPSNLGTRPGSTGSTGSWGEPGFWDRPGLWDKIFSAGADPAMETYDASPVDVMAKSAKMNELEREKRISELDQLMIKQEEVTKDAIATASVAMGAASKKYGIDPMAGISGMGLNLMGVSKIEAEQMAGAIAQSGGGYVSDAMKQGIIGSGFAAKTAFGIGPETTGAFLSAGRRGGMVGAEGRAGKSFEDAIAQGLEMGLSRSEVNKWMQMTAQGIQQFESTGIEINPTSISKLAGDISGAGITGTRALSMARGLSGGLQSIGSQGIQTGTDMMMLQLVGGYKGGGAADYRAARSRMEQLDISGQGVGGLAGNTKVSEALKRIMGMAGGDNASQAEMLQQTVTKMGGMGSVQEFDWLQRKLSGGVATPEQLAAIQKEQAKRAAGKAEAGIGLQKLAGGMVSGYAPGAKAKSGLENEQIAVGGKMVSVVIALEKSSINTTRAFTELAGGPLKDVAASLGKLSVEAIKLVNIIKEGGSMPWSFNK